MTAITAHETTVISEQEAFANLIAYTQQIPTMPQAISREKACDRVVTQLKTEPVDFQHAFLTAPETSSTLASWYSSADAKEALAEMILAQPTLERRADILCQPKVFGAITRAFRHKGCYHEQENTIAPLLQEQPAAIQDKILSGYHAIAQLVFARQGQVVVDILKTRPPETVTRICEEAKAPYYETNWKPPTGSINAIDNVHIAVNSGVDYADVDGFYGVKKPAPTIVYNALAKATSNLVNKISKAFCPT